MKTNTGQRVKNWGIANQQRTIEFFFHVSLTEKRLKQQKYIKKPTNGYKNCT